MEMFFAVEQKAIDDLETVIAAVQVELDEMIENAEEDSIIGEVLKENGNLDKPGLKKKLKDEEPDAEDKAVLQKLQDLVTRVDDGAKTLKDLRAALDKKTRDQYPKLTDGQCVDLLLERKWYRSLRDGVFALYMSVSHAIATRNAEIAERYEKTLPELETEVADYATRVKGHLERMGFVW
jgi:type I restriction enzyme M protein